MAGMCRVGGPFRNRLNVNNLVECSAYDVAYSMTVHGEQTKALL
jgi:hypothetical protein